MFKYVGLINEKKCWVIVDSEFQEIFRDYTMHELLPYSVVIDKTVSLYKEKKYNLLLVMKWIKSYNPLDYKYAENYFKKKYPEDYEALGKYKVLL